MKTTTFSNQDSAKTLSICNAELLQRHKDRNSFRITGNTQGIELQNSVKFTEVLQYKYVNEVHFCMNFLTEKFVLSMIICIFAVSVPTKPLNDAQMRGAFFIYTFNYSQNALMERLPHFTKHYTTEADLVALLESRGLVISDEAKAVRYLESIGYYRLSAYMYPFLKVPKESHQYKEGSTFLQVLNLYRFDKKLRMLLLNEIEKVEIAIRRAIMNIPVLMTGDIYWLTNPVVTIQECGTRSALSCLFLREGLPILGLPCRQTLKECISLSALSSTSLTSYHQTMICWERCTHYFPIIRR